ncbi:MAG TPA: AI-2E family transporter, partial [Bacillus bacterium]|nr:AI-2E family transporter [Bacillus sp. (in: firmicutes)]
EEITNESEKVINENQLNVVSPNELKQKAISYLGKVSKNLGENIMSVFSFITSVATVLVVVPFLAFFFLKDEEKLRPYIIKL